MGMENANVSITRWHTCFDQEDERVEQAFQTAQSQLQGNELEEKEQEEEEEDEEEEDEDEGVITSIDDAEYPELFQPTHPLQINRILDDIPEEELEEELVTNQQQVTSIDPASIDFEKLLQEIRSSKLLEITQRGSYRLSRQSSLVEKPLFPSSPPPGPILSSNFPTPILESSEGGRFSIEFTPDLIVALNRLSTMSTDDTAPPILPVSPPPGHRLSPQHSLETDETSTDSRTTKSLAHPTNHEVTGSVSELPPPIERADSLDHSQSSRTKLHLSPSFLRTLTPPDEFGNHEEELGTAELNQSVSSRQLSLSSASSTGLRDWEVCA